MTVEETTERPPAPTVTDLDVPANFTSTARTETSITLGWSAVTDAVGYEVDQRLGTETSWDEDGPSCGSAGVVPDTTCVATGLSPGLEYDFRVKALAGGDDTTTQDSDWSQTYSRATSGTAPPPTFETTSDLNIRWKSNATSITWTWDPVEGRELRDRTEYLVQVIPSGSGECARLEYASPGTAVSRTAPPDPPAWGNIGKALSFIYTPGTLNAGTLNGLCVVATWENELPNGVTLRAYGTPERIWASAAPGVPSDLADASNPEKRDSGALKTSWLEWTYEADAGFTYPGLLVSLGGDRDTEDLDCDSGGEDVKAPAEVTTENRQARHRETNLKPYRHYQLCLQAKNEFGSSEMVGIGMVTTTRPAAPKSVTYVRADEIVRTHASGSHLVERLVWSVPETDGTPSRDDKFDSVVILSTKSSIGSNDMNTACTATGGVTLAPGDPATTYRLVGDSRTDDDNVASRTSATGIEVVASHATDLLGLHVPAGDPATYYFYACVRANPDPDGFSLDDDGPWKISAARSVSRKLSTPSRVRVSRVTSVDDFTATVDWNAVNGAGAYVVQLRTRMRTRDRTRTTATASWGGYGSWTSWDADWTASGGTWTGVSGCTESGCTALSGGAYDDVTDPDGATRQTQTDVQTQVRVRATATVGGTSLTSLWSSGTEVSHTKP
ncbi:MAG: fibronectin type III domain-containing protein [Gammaproteobacteria bacterium]|nr:fibronectin type III domain-containing protein [Gammaproteobacteria bacterium]